LLHTPPISTRPLYPYAPYLHTPLISRGRLPLPAQPTHIGESCNEGSSSCRFYWKTTLHNIIKISGIILLTAHTCCIIGQCNCQESINVCTKAIGIESFGRTPDDASSSFTLLNSGPDCRGKSSTVGLTSSMCAPQRNVDRITSFSCPISLF